MKKILLIDDDKTMLRLTELLFKDKYKVHFAMNGNNIRKKVEKLDPSIIILDNIFNGVRLGEDILKKILDGDYQNHIIVRSSDQDISFVTFKTVDLKKMLKQVTFLPKTQDITLFRKMVDFFIDQ